MNEPLNSTLAVIGGAVSTAIAFLFDVPVPVVIAAFGGACFGVGFSGSVSYLRGALLIAAGTVAASMITPLVLHYFGDGGYPPRGVAAVLAFVLVCYRGLIVKQIERFLISKTGDPA